MSLIKILQERFKKWKDGRPEMLDTVHFRGVYFRVWDIGRELYVRIDNSRNTIYLSIT